MKQGIIKAIAGDVVLMRKPYSNPKERKALHKHFAMQPGITAIQYQIVLEGKWIDREGRSQWGRPPTFEKRLMGDFD